MDFPPGRKKVAVAAELAVVGRCPLVEVLLYLLTLEEIDYTIMIRWKWNI